MRKSNYLILKFLITLLIFSASVNQIYPQQFGQNKVQYKVFKWKYLQTKHFDIYFYQGGHDIAQFTAHTAEHALSNLTENLDYRINERIPIIVYNSHNDFQQNNVIDEYLPEGVGGVTELFKNRVNVPFEGNYEKFRHVIHHELLHAFMNEMYYGGSIQNIISRSISLSFPLWFSEGMAEVQSLYGMDKATDMYMRDATINNYVPPLDYIGGYFSYRGGQSFFSFLADTYGEDKLGALMNNIKTFGDVDQGFRETYKMNTTQLNEKWQTYLKKTYWPDIKFREDVKDFAKQLTNHEKDGGYYNVAPVISPDGSMFAYISNRDDLFDVFIAKTKNGEIIKKVIEGNNSTDFEELHILTPGLSWSPDGRKLAISVKAGEKDVIYLVDIFSEDKTELPLKFNAINYVNWSPVSGKIAFIGDSGDRSNLYVYDIKTRVLDAMTDDVFSDANPTWSWDGKRIFFTSDRGSYTDPKKIPADLKMWNYDYSYTDYYSVDVQTKKIVRMSDSKDSKESYVQVSADGKKVLFLSDKSGITNIYLREQDSLGNFKDRPITNALNPIDQLSLSKDGKKLLFTSLNKGGYDIFSIDNPFDIKLDIDEIVLTDYQKDFLTTPNRFGRESGKEYADTTKINDSLYNIAGNDTADFIDNDSSGLVVKDTLPENPEEVIKTEMAQIDSVLSISSDSVKNQEKNNTIGNLLNPRNSDTVKYYGDDVKISFDTPKIDYSQQKDSVYLENLKFNIKDNTNSDGSYKINKYKIKFSPDLIYGNATYTSFYGVQGIAQVMLSDMLGDHRIFIQTSLVIDIKNSDYAVAYYYLPKRIDYGAALYHTARFVNFGSGFYSNLYRYTTIGGSVSASYPFSRFKRIEGRLQFENVARENLDVVVEPKVSKNLLVPTFSFIHDNTQWGYAAPVAGTRYNLTLFGSPKLGSEGIGFASFLYDFRHYIKLGDDYTFVTRLSGGASYGPNPQRFFIGGVENWINSTYENYNIPIYNIGDFSFSSPGLPLRGYNYDRQSGSKYALANIELRFPLFRYLLFGALPLGFANIEGVTFLDVGTAWSDDNALKLFGTGVNGQLKANDLLTGIGCGARVNFLGQPVMFDIGWGYNFDKFTAPIYYISFGYDF
ncbi:MAG: PD40 domain-containing protein [Ignavibacteria bacterium]|nr:PD40 domain-containing protein [Ignavibacteria bacterium]